MRKRIKRRVILFGAGKTARDIWRQISEKPDVYTDEYLAFADNSPGLWGTDFCGRRVIAPAEIKSCPADLVVITSVYADAIKKQLTEELGIEEKKICLFGQYARQSYAEWIYRERYPDGDSAEKKKGFDTKKIVIYTAITGHYDVLREPPVFDGLTYVCFTNTPDLKSEVWNVEPVRNGGMDDVHLARHIKMNPQEFFPDYETSVWVDGKYQILEDLRTYIAQYEREADILCFPHPERRCICDEAAACIWWEKGDKKDILLQAADYVRDGYPVNHGLYETGCMVRAHNDDKVKRLMRKWEDELLKHSVRDQLSFPYVCWKSGFMPDICSLDVERNQWLLYKRGT